MRAIPVSGAATAASDGRRVVINADDFGLTDAINRGIGEAFAAGGVSSASALVNTAGWPDAARRTRALAPALGVGLHFNLTAGRPLSPPRDVPSLVDARTGDFLTLPRLVARALSGRIAADQVAAECRAQIARFSRDTGLAPTHLDGHRHVHAIPGIHAAVAAVARDAGIAHVRRPVERLREHPARLVASMKKVVIGAAWGASRDAAGSGLRPRFHGISSQGHRCFLADLLEAVDSIPAGGAAEIMVHPGYPDAELEAWDGYTRARRVELEALCSPMLGERLRRGDVRLVTFAGV